MSFDLNSSAVLVDALADFNSNAPPDPYASVLMNHYDIQELVDMLFLWGFNMGSLRSILLSFETSRSWKALDHHLGSRILRW